MANPKTLIAKPVASPDAHLGFEAQLWAAADKMRGHIETSRSILCQSARPRQPAVNIIDWSRRGRMRSEVRWTFGMPPVNNPRCLRAVVITTSQNALSF